MQRVVRTAVLCELATAAWVQRSPAAVLCCCPACTCLLALNFTVDDAWRPSPRHRPPSLRRLRRRWRADRAAAQAAAGQELQRLHAEWQRLDAPWKRLFTEQQGLLELVFAELQHPTLAAEERTALMARLAAAQADLAAVQAAMDAVLTAFVRAAAPAAVGAAGPAQQAGATGQAGQAQRRNERGSGSGGESRTEGVQNGLAAAIGAAVEAANRAAPKVGQQQQQPDVAVAARSPP